MTLSFRQFFLLFALSVSAGQAAAQALPSTMRLVGTVSKSSDGTVVPVDGDSVLAVNTATNTTESSAIVAQGAYTLMLSGINGTPIALRLQHAGGIYKLLLANSSSDAAFQISGNIFSFSTPTPMNVMASSQAVSTTTPVTGTGTGTGTVTAAPPAAVLGDLNGDGVVNEVDVGLLKQAISGDIAIDKTKMDINGDQVVNTRDLIDLIRMVRENSIAARKPVSIIPVRQ